MAEEFIPCFPKALPSELAILAAETADRENPSNKPRIQGLASLGLTPDPDQLAAMRAKHWGSKGVRLTVGFLEPVQAALRDRILLHANEWDKWCNVQFTYTSNTAEADVRITLLQQGYWSYLGTDIRHIPRNQPTMCLQGFSLAKPEFEFRRVVTHEFGHTCGFPHEHMRRAIIARIDEQKCIAYFQQTQGWSASMTRSQVLTPLEEQALLGSPDADETSIMAYSLPGSITKDGRPIIGGNDLSESDKRYCNEIYPEVVIPKPTEPAAELIMAWASKIDFARKIMSVRLPSGWQVLKLSDPVPGGLFMDSETLLQQFATEVEGCLPAAAPGAGVLSDVFIEAQKLVAALRAKDYWAAFDSVVRIIGFLRRPDGSISFAPGAMNAGINWGNLISILKRLLPILIDSLSA